MRDSCTQVDEWQLTGMLAPQAVPEMVTAAAGGDGAHTLEDIAEADEEVSRYAV
jgi:hypothetical protein